MEYTLLELIDNPKRIGNIKHDRIFDYVLESLENFDRFEVFIKILEKGYSGLYNGFVLSASDLYPLDKIFSMPLENPSIKPRNMNDGSNENALWNKIQNSYIHGTINNLSVKEEIINYMSTYFFEDVYRFCKDVLQKREHEKLYNAFEKLYKSGKLKNTDTLKYFSFSYNHKYHNMDNNSLSKVCIPIKNVEKLLCIGSVLYNKNMEDVTEKYKNVITVMKNSQRDFTSNGTGKRLNFDYITFVYTSEFIPFMYQNLFEYYLPLAIKVYPLSDNDFANYMISGADMILMIGQGNKIIGIVSEDTGVLEKKIINSNKIKYFRLDSLFGTHVNCLICSGENMEDTIVYVPDGYILDESKEDYKLETYKFRNQYFLRKV